VISSFPTFLPPGILTGIQVDSSNYHCFNCGIASLRDTPYNQEKYYTHLTHLFPQYIHQYQLQANTG
jgi:hypothetical protein